MSRKKSVLFVQGSMLMNLKYRIDFFKGLKRDIERLLSLDKG